MDVLALFGWRTCRETPFKNSFSSASLPTRPSRAAMRASYSASTSAAAVSLSSPPASNLATQILIRLRPIPWRLARACSDSPPRNSWTTWRLNSIERVRCLAMGFLLESPVQLADSHLPHLSTPRGALHYPVNMIWAQAVPGRYFIAYYDGSIHGTPDSGPMVKFQILDVRQDATSTYIDTDLGSTLPRPTFLGGNPPTNYFLFPAQTGGQSANSGPSDIMQFFPLRKPWPTDNSHFAC